MKLSIGGRYRAGLAVGLVALTMDVTAASETRTVTAGERYRASGFHRWVLGDDYRDLWTTPLEADVLDLATFAGGLRPVMRVGGMQTLGLAFAGQDGRSYSFRGVDKALTEILPEGLRDTLAEHLVQDQIAASHPAGALVVPPLAEAAGVLHSKPVFVVMPDDPGLGEFREAFAGALGTLEEYPGAVSETNPGFHGAEEILDHEEMWKRLMAGPADRADSRAYLRARLLDLMLGDWDRHRKQWRWARLPGDSRWQPIPEDRDLAFANYEGLTLAAARRWASPQLITFRESYPGLEGLTWNGRDVDRYLLTDLERPVWEEIAADVRDRVTDEVIEAAVRRMPPEYYELNGKELAGRLRKRRDGLPEVAGRFYRHLVGQVDIHCTDVDETARIERLEGGDVQVAIAVTSEDGSSAAPYYRRRFRPEETSEIRIYLHGGNDRAVSTGRPRGGIKVHVIGGQGADLLDDSQGGGTRFWDFRGPSQVLKGPGTSVDSRKYEWPEVNPRAPWIPPRDWGRRTFPTVLLGYGTDYGVFLGAGFDTQAFGFRKFPYASRHRLDVAWAVQAESGQASYLGDFRRSSSSLYTTLAARASGVEILHYYGLGNETSSEEPLDFYKIRQQQFSFAPALHVSPAPRLELWAGLQVKFATTELDPETLLGETQPYGTDDYGQLGAGLGLQLDTRDGSDYRDGGVRVEASGSFYPEAWDVESSFGGVEGSVAGYLPLGGRATLALRLGGRKVFGTYPFHEAAYLGGHGTIRGYRADRFAGDASAYGNLELRLTLGKAFLLVPGEFGVFGLGDVGRVFVEGESSDEWHPAAGGGIFFAVLSRSTVFSLAVARSDEHTSVLFASGFGF
jgi:hypothetical protein